MKLRELIEAYDPASNTKGNISIRIYPEVGSGEYLDLTLKKDSSGKTTLNSFIGSMVLEKEVIKIQVIDFNMLAVHLGAEVVEEVESEEPEPNGAEDVQDDEGVEDEAKGLVPKVRKEKEQEEI